MLFGIQYKNDQKHEKQIHFFFWLTLTGSILTQCRSHKEVEPLEPEITKIDFDIGAVRIMDQLASQLKGK